MSSKSKLDFDAIFIDSTMYTVTDMPDWVDIEEEGPELFRLNMAYRINTDMTKGIFPYRGVIKKGEPWGHRKPGIYLKRDEYNRWHVKMIYPRREEAQSYKPDKVKSMVSAIIGNDIEPDEFKELTVDVSKGDSFMPPLRTNDDFLNKLVKMGIRLKDAPFAPYGKRLKALAMNKASGIEGTNMMNNIKRGILINKAMSPSRAMACTDTWEMEMALVIRDKPGASNPMFEDGSMLVIYPNGEPYYIDPDKLIDSEELINEAILETNKNSNNNEEDMSDD